MNLYKIILGLLVVLLCVIAGSEALKFNSIFSIGVVTCCILIVLQLCRIDFSSPMSMRSEPFITEEKIAHSMDKIIGTQTKDNEDSSKTKPKKKATFTFIYADWCGHCRKTKPVWAKLEKAVKTIGEYEIVYKQLDAEAPENAKWIEMYNVAAYPFIILTIDANKKKVFSGERSVSGFRAFLEKHLNPSE